jgi:hypothetical protein
MQASTGGSSIALENTTQETDGHVCPGASIWCNAQTGAGLVPRVSPVGAAVCQQARACGWFREHAPMPCL